MVVEAPAQGRRVVVAAIVVGLTVVAAVAAVVSERRTDDARSADWDRIALVDGSGVVTVHDESARRVLRVDTGLDDRYVIQMSRSVLAVTSGPDVVFVDTATGDTVRATGPPGTVFDSLRDPVVGTERPALIGGSGESGPTTLISTNGDALDIVTATGWDRPLANAFFIQSSPDDRTLVISESATVADDALTALVSFEDVAEAVGIPGVVSMVGDDTVISQSGPTRNTRTRLTEYAFDGRTVGRPVELEPFIGAVRSADGRALVVAADGTITRVSLENTTVERTGAVEVVDGGLPNIWTTEGRHAPFVVSGDHRGGARVVATVIGDDGTINGSYTALTPIDRVRLSVDPGCALIETEDGSSVLIDMVDGDELATTDDPNATFVKASRDGCTVAMDTVVLTPAGAYNICCGAGARQVSPDGETVAFLTERGVELRPSDDVDGDATLLIPTESPVGIFFTSS